MQDFSHERHGADARFPVDAEHWHRYLFARHFTQNKTVLDIACGEGYGANCLSANADIVIAVDADESVVKHAQKKYKSENLQFLHGSLQSIPIPEKSVSVVTSFETIEHITEHEEGLAEIKRVMTNDGLLIISTPNKKEYSDKRNYQNPFHVKELYFEEFELLLKNKFKFVCIYHQQFMSASIIWPQLNNSHAQIEFHELQQRQSDESKMGMYFIAIASDSPLPINGASVLNFTNQWDATIEKDKQAIYQSASYKIGNKIVRLFNGLKKLWKKK